MCVAYNQSSSTPNSDFVINWDVILLAEAKFMDKACPIIPGYKVFVKNRHGLSRSSSGGIAIAIRDKLCAHASVDTNKPDYVLWLNLKSKSENISIAVVYLPPERSRHSSIDSYNAFENEVIDKLLKMCKFINICICNDRVGVGSR